MADIITIDLHCELGEYVAACVSSITIVIKYNPVENKYAFSSSRFQELTETYKDDGHFFAAVHDDLEEYRRSDQLKGRHYNWVGHNLLEITPWVLEMRYRTKGAQPYRQAVVEYQYLTFRELRKTGHLSVGQVAHDDEFTPEHIQFFMYTREVYETLIVSAHAALKRPVGVLMLHVHNIARS